MADLKNKKHLFFDLDDTLWDFRANSGVVLEDLFVKHRLEEKLNAGFEIFHRTYLEVNIDMWSKFARKEITKAELRGNRFSRVFAMFGYSSEEEAITLTEQYIGRAPKGKSLIQDCVEVLGYLKNKYTLHIITNGFEEVQFIKIDGCGLRPFFKNIIISEQHLLAKPDVELFRLAEKLSGARASECVMIGDSFDSDIEGAVNAGWQAIHFTSQPSQHKGIVISKLNELKNYF